MYAMQYIGSNFDPDHIEGSAMQQNCKWDYGIKFYQDYTEITPALHRDYTYL